jgi:hypothetical protein
MANSKFTMEISESGERAQENEFALESYTLGADPAFPEEVRNVNVGEKSFLIAMSAKLVEFHRLTSSSLMGKRFPKVWIRSYQVQDDESTSKAAEYEFEDAQPIAFKMNSGFEGLSGLVTFVYGKASTSQNS